MKAAVSNYAPVLVELLKRYGPEYDDSSMLGYMASSMVGFEVLLGDPRYDLNQSNFVNDSLTHLSNPKSEEQFQHMLASGRFVKITPGRKETFRDRIERYQRNPEVVVSKNRSNADLKCEDLIPSSFHPSLS